MASLAPGCSIYKRAANDDSSSSAADANSSLKLHFSDGMAFAFQLTNNSLNQVEQCKNFNQSFC